MPKTAIASYTHEEWLAEAERRFGPDAKKWKFVCPSCKHVASVQDWKDAGAPESGVAFSCVGRWISGTEGELFDKKGGPCNYAGGGLFRLNPITVTMPDGSLRHAFAFAEEAVDA